MPSAYTHITDSIRRWWSGSKSMLMNSFISPRGAKLEGILLSCKRLQYLSNVSEPARTPF